MKSVEHDMDRKNGLVVFILQCDLLHQGPSDENADLASANAAAVCHTAWMQSLQLNLQHGVLPTHAVHGEYTGNQLI